MSWIDREINAIDGPFARYFAKKAAEAGVYDGQRDNPPGLVKLADSRFYAWGYAAGQALRRESPRLRTEPEEESV